MPRRRKKSDSATYWHDRAIQLTQKQLEEDTNLVETFSKEYMRLKFDLEKELAVFYQRYADNEGISMAEARKLLKGAELKNFRMGLDEFREKAIQGGFEKELDEVYLRSRVSRLQALQAQLDMHAKALYSEQEQTLTEHLGARYKDTYYQTVYAISQQNTIASTFAHVDGETLDKVLSSPWLEDNFSGRIWENRDKLIRELRQTLSRGIVRGDSLDEMTKALAKQMDTAESRAATLVHTESAHIAAEASLAGYKETGVQRYTFDATLDSKTCSYCGQMDQLQFPLSEQETGVNYPPLHPRCRCTTLPVTGFQIGSKRAARNPKTGKTEYVEKGMTYEEWRKKYVEDDENPETKTPDVDLPSIRKEIMKKNDFLKTKQQKTEFQSIVNNMDANELGLYKNMMGAVEDTDHYYDRGTGWYMPGKKRVEMDVDQVQWDGAVGRNVHGAWKVKLHEESHQLDHVLASMKSPFALIDGTIDEYAYWSFTDIRTVTGKRLIQAIDSDILNMVNRAIEKFDTTGKQLKSLGRIPQNAKDSLIMYLRENYPTAKDRALIDTVTDAIGMSTKGRIHPYSHGFWGHTADYCKGRGKDGAVSEMWANINAFLLRGDTEALEAVAKEMPLSVEEFTKVHNEIIEYSKTHVFSYGGKDNV